ncbi:MAG: PSD1 and planctomycete cytochrome C domain-containing protein [Gemmataceae bacterium]|nr:PSD1 and planctomycete cytochrome C domain-containing protein [Gemmataceae bacterium]
MTSPRQLIGLSILCASFWPWSARADQPMADAAGAKFFDKEVKPILQAHCFSCHGGEKKLKGGLNLTSRATLLEGGDHGEVIDLKKPRASLLLDAIHYKDKKMPPRGKLPQAQIEVLTKWVEMGVPYSDKAVVRHGPPKVDAKAKNFWAFRPVKRPDLPAVKKEAWVRNPIDAFVLAKLEAAGFEPAPPADKIALLRRVTYDLIGLPPTPDEVKAFLADNAPDAYEKVVDRLLASPHYGERWGRHWLDLVRYAETDSYERDGAKPFVWRYRDYVIRSLNEDKPYDQFIRDQLAGDELDKVTPDSIIATGYYRLGLWDDEPADPLLAMYDDLDDIVTTTGQTFLGLTVNCCRCHDHKIDPLPQKDYYRFLAFFHGIRRYGVRAFETVAAASLRPIALPEEAELQKKKIAEHKRRLDELAKKIEAIETEIEPKLEGGEKDDFKFPANRPGIVSKHAGGLVTFETFSKYRGLRLEREKLEKNAPTGMAQALCVTEVGPQPPETFVLARGNPQAKGDKVEPGFPSVLTDVGPVLPTPQSDAQSSGRRRVLAEWVASKDNALTWRVIANRLWQHHFGRGIVRSSSNFGYQGTPPTHPELLDWLASEFVSSGTRFKAMHRLMVLSNTYRMSAQPIAGPLAKDPENDLMWRFNPRRLSAEEVRDSILAASGNINLKKMFGPSIYPKIPAEVLAGQSQPGLGWGKSSPEEAARRSIYVHVKRSLPLPILSAFDAADTDATCPVRFTTTQPTQALGMINGEFMNDQAKVFAEDAAKNAGNNVQDQVRAILWRVTQREPTAKEIERGVRFMDRLRQDNIAAPEALRLYCLLALNLNEFMFLD